jgi:hypothetical protein
MTSSVPVLSTSRKYSRALALNADFDMERAMILLLWPWSFYPVEKPIRQVEVDPRWVSP